MSLPLAPRTWIPLAAGGVGAALIGVALFTIGPLAPDDPSEGTPTADAHPSGEPTASPTGPEPTTSGPAPLEIEFAFRRETVIDDATALDRMANPRTGETWHEPRLYTGTADGFVPIPGDYTRYDPATTLLVDVGDRAGADIVAQVSTWWARGEGALDYYPHASLSALFEVHNDLAYRITCPAERDACPDDSGVWRYRTDAVFYDSLSLPSSIEFGEGLVIEPYSDWNNQSDAVPLVQAADPGWFTTAYAPTREKIVDLGSGALYRLDLGSEIAGLTDSYFELMLASGEARVARGPWIDGPRWAAPGSDYPWGVRATRRWCEELGGFPMYTREVDHHDSEWVANGGYFSPIPGGNPIAQGIYDEMSARAGDDYVFASYEDFLAAGSVRAGPAPDGEWMVFVSWEAYAERPENADDICD